MNLKHHALPFFAAVMVTAAILATVVMLDRSEQAQFREKSRADALAQLSVIRARLEGALNSRLYLTRGLEAFAVTHPEGGAGEFPAFARALLAQQTGIRSIQLAPGSVVSQVYPVKGNEAAVGLRLLEQPRQHEAVRHAISSGSTVVAGPVDLVQGGVAFVSRTPVFQERPLGKRSYWGLATVVIDRDMLFHEAGLQPEDAGFYYALRGKDALGAQGLPFWGYQWIFGANPVALGVSLPGGSWQVAALPKKGWGGAPTTWLRAGGGLLAAVAGLLVWFLVRNPVKLREAVAEATQALRNREADLREAEGFLQRVNEELESRVKARTAELSVANEQLRREIAERQGMERALQTRITAIEAAAETVVITDREGIIEYVNPAFSAVTGYEPAEAIGRNSSILQSGTHDEAFYRHLWQTILAGEVWHGEIINRRKNGELYVEETTVAPVKDPAGEIIRFVAIKHDITARKRTEQALAEQNALYLALLKAQSDVGEGVMLVDDGRISFANEAFCRLTGYSEEELKSLPSYAAVVNPDDRLRAEANYQRRLSGEQFANRYEIGVLTRDGRRLDAEIAGAAVQISAKRLVVVVVLDITERKRAEAALKSAHDELEVRVQERTSELAKSERKHRTLLEHLPQRIFFKDRESVYISCNERFAKDLGILSGHVQGKTDFDFFPAKLAEKYRADDQRVMARDAVEEFEERYVVDGEERYIHTVKTPVHDEKGEMTGILGIFWDITDRKRAEDILKHHAQIIDQIHDSVIATDLDGYITFWNQGAEAMFGYSAEEGTRQHISLIYPDAHYPSMRQDVIDYLREKGVYEVEAWRQKKSGETIYVHLVLSLLKNREGQVIGLVGNSMDITERMRLEREIIDVSEEEQKRIGQELHDGLGQHLTGIAFLSKVLEQKLLAKNLPEARDAAEVVQFVNQAVSKTRSLARGLYPVELETNGLMSALEQLAARVKKLFGIDCEFRCREPVLVSDSLVAINLYRIAQEAVNNAVKHSGARHVVIDLSGGHDRAGLSVSDDGAGFEMSALENGKGMGLHIMQYRAKMIGTNLDIRKNSKGGVTVSVS